MERSEKLANILIVDDEPQIRKLLKLTLEMNGLKVLESPTGREGTMMAAQNKIDLIILDLGLPDIYGLDVLKRIRDWSEVPIIILSVLNEHQTIISALNAGADDYLTKPFNVDELMARINVCLRRSNKNVNGGDPLFKIRGLEVDLNKRTVSLNGRPVKLTATEYELLRLFIKNPGKVLTHQFILKEIWGPQNLENNQYPRVYVRHLRQKIEENPNLPELIITESRVGYRFKTPA